MLTYKSNTENYYGILLVNYSVISLKDCGIYRHKQETFMIFHMSKYIFNIRIFHQYLQFVRPTLSVNVKAEE